MIIFLVALSDYGTGTAVVGGGGNDWERKKLFLITKNTSSLFILVFKLPGIYDIIYRFNNIALITLYTHNNNSLLGVVAAFLLDGCCYNIKNNNSH